MAYTWAERNHNNWKKAIRKQKIVHNWCSGEFGEYYPTLHQYMDNKIHCSCPLCNCKTKNKGKRRNIWAPSYNPSVHDIKRNDDMYNQLEEIN